MMIKPDGVQRNLIATILDRFLAKVRSLAQQQQHAAASQPASNRRQQCVARCPLYLLYLQVRCPAVRQWLTCHRPARPATPNPPPPAGLHPAWPEVPERLQVPG